MLCLKPLQQKFLPYGEKICSNLDTYDQEKENHICSSKYTGAEFEANMKHASMQSLF